MTMKRSIERTKETYLSFCKGVGFYCPDEMKRYFKNMLRNSLLNVEGVSLNNLEEVIQNLDIKYKTIDVLDGFLIQCIDVEINYKEVK